MTSTSNTQDQIRLKYDIIDVFTSTKYLGNPLAIVHIPNSNSNSNSNSTNSHKIELTKRQKQIIAREFNLSETVFLHESPQDPNTDTPIKIDIFAKETELPFAGHPTIGSSWYLLSGPGSQSITQNHQDTITLNTLSGLIPAIRQEGTNKVRLEVPTDYKEHNPIQLDSFKSAQHRLESKDYANGLDGSEDVVSIVKGMTFVLVKLNSEDALNRLKFVVGGQSIEIPWLGEWQGHVGLYAFYERPEDGVVRTRMFNETLEDPATGSAASTLGGYLAKRKGEGKWKIEIVQGVEMNRRSEIEVMVEVGEDGDIRKIELGGEAVGVMSGYLVVPS